MLVLEAFICIFQLGIFGRQQFVFATLLVSFSKPLRLGAPALFETLHHLLALRFT